MEVKQHLCRSHFSPATLWIPEIEPGSSGSAESNLTYWVKLLTKKLKTSFVLDGFPIVSTLNVGPQMLAKASITNLQPQHERRSLKPRFLIRWDSWIWRKMERFISNCIVSILLLILVSTFLFFLSSWWFCAIDLFIFFETRSHCITQASVFHTLPASAC